ncbi:hypothetical protein HNR02_005662 [Amycolatopsis endophytica]|uniref:Uncharacterized protein n=1 Tax=Amycolatopsis endophytica TaxID=860233 RepID=A0A853BC86_9PSEU|nr:hypothetical protein [Amycolatopsis endophytica]
MLPRQVLPGSRLGRGSRSVDPPATDPRERHRGKRPPSRYRFPQHDVIDARAAFGYGDRATTLPEIHDAKLRTHAPSRHTDLLRSRPATILHGEPRLLRFDIGFKSCRSRSQVRIRPAVRRMPGWHVCARQWNHGMVTARSHAVPAAEIPSMGSREVYVHAVDLGAGVTVADLPGDFLASPVDDIVAKRGLAIGRLPVVDSPSLSSCREAAGRPRPRPRTGTSRAGGNAHQCSALRGRRAARSARGAAACPCRASSTAPSPDNR